VTLASPRELEAQPHLLRHRARACASRWGEETPAHVGEASAMTAAEISSGWTTTSSRRPRVGETPRPREEATVAHRRHRWRGCHTVHMHCHPVVSSTPTTQQIPAGLCLRP
jgi:hypothetical protein